MRSAQTSPGSRLRFDTVDPQVMKGREKGRKMAKAKRAKPQDTPRRPFDWGPVREAALILALVLGLGLSAMFVAASDATAVRLLWFAGNIGYQLATLEQAISELLP